MPECPHHGKVVPLAESNPDRIGKVFVEYPILETGDNLRILDIMDNFTFGAMNMLMRNVFSEDMIIRGIRHRLFPNGLKTSDTHALDIFKLLNITCPDTHDLMLQIGECDSVYRRGNGRLDARKVMMDMDLYNAYSSRGKGCRVAGLLNGIGEEMRFNLGLKKEEKKREFSCIFGFEASVDIYLTDMDHRQKPDIALVNAGGPATGEKYTWAEIHCPIVWFNDRYAHEKAFRQLLVFAQHMFMVQPRRFVPGLAILDKHIMLFIFDRAGAYGSTQYRIAEEALQYIVAALLFVDDVDLGYDMSVDYNKEERVTVNGNKYQIKGIIFDNWDLVGHGTIVRLVERDGKSYVNKDVWVHRSHEQEEQDILKRIKGVKHVVQLVEHETLKVRDDKLDSTHDRWQDVHNTEFLKKKIWKSKILDHHQFILTPFGQPLNTFTSLIELVSALCDVAHTIRELMKMGIYHADISHKNIVLVPDPDPSVKLRRGYLIDFGHSIDRYKGGGGVKPRGQFFNMALEVLWAGTNSDYVDHRAYTDLESLFYVLIWECVMHSGPDRDYISEQDLKKTMISRWKGDDCTEGDPWLYCWQQKNKDVAAAYEFEHNVIPLFQPYFRDLIPLACELRNIIHVPQYTEKERLEQYERLDELQWELSERIRIGRIRTLAEDVKEQQKVCDDSIPFVDREEEIVEALIDAWDKCLRKLRRAELRERLENPRPKVIKNRDGTRAPLPDDYEEEVDIPDDISLNSTPEQSEESEDDYFKQFHVDTDIEDGTDLDIGRAIMYDDEYFLAHLTLQRDPPFKDGSVQILRASDIRRSAELRALPKRKPRRDYFDRWPTKNPAPPGDQYRREREQRLKAKLKRRREREAAARLREAEAAEEAEAAAKREAEAQKAAEAKKKADARLEAERRRKAEAFSAASSSTPAPPTSPTPANVDLKRKRGASEERDSGYDSAIEEKLANAKRQKTDAES